MLFSLTMFPVGNGPSVRKPVAEVIEVLDRAGLHYEVSAADTVIEGDWDQVLPAIHDAEQKLRARHGRVFVLLTVDDYGGGANRIHEAVEDVERELHHAVRH
ncbi:MAG: MTH1187 family thiamine-binding protein [Gemmatimonadota bacterium]|nr:MTH1187 family thiamine-binding protein [Gemmatimonadota bacterium]MDE3127542.1 MTH1187 family thiamine-binding protein [Gemmatimonadota bacterium]MDE3172908.1 MTH1187 family thiamine-binding protein [Gemmatimonadota bacterium]MDE3215924.1 MTH1187 family thiamine-binding protein [Gemmatimonadota bacterium]